MHRSQLTLRKIRKKNEAQKLRAPIKLNCHWRWQLYISSTHLPLVLHIYASVNQVSTGSDNGLLPIQHQAIIWNSAGLLSTGPLGTNFSEILTKIQNFSLTNMHRKKIAREKGAILRVNWKSEWKGQKFTRRPPSTENPHACPSYVE